MVAVGFYGPDKSSMEVLDQHFSLGHPAKSITALPSWDGQQLPSPRAASTSPALPGAARMTHPVRKSPAPRQRPIPHRRRLPWRNPESLKGAGLLWSPQTPTMEPWVAIPKWGVGDLSSHPSSEC